MNNTILIGKKCLVAMLLIFFLSGCHDNDSLSSSNSEYKRNIDVSVLIGEHATIIGESTLHLDDSEDAVFTIEPEQGYRVRFDTYCEQDGNTYNFGPFSFHKTIHTYVEKLDEAFLGYSKDKSLSEGGAIVSYDPFYKGNNIVKNNATADDISVSYYVDGINDVRTFLFDKKSKYLAPLTLRVGEINKDNATLIEYRDEDGKPYNLGALTDFCEKGNHVLHCVFEKWSDPTCFDYVVTEDEIGITDCNSLEKKIVIPSYIEGKKVTKISSFAFYNSPVETLVLSDNTLVIEDLAFVNCLNLNKVYMNDYVYYLTNYGFYNSRFSTLCMNARYAPDFIENHSGVMRVQTQAIMYHKKQNKKVIAFYGGSSTKYAYKFSDINENYDNTVFINLGLNATICAPFMITCFSHLLDEGDVIVHSPEYYENQYYNVVNNVVWEVMETNYTAFRYVDGKKYWFFGEYTNFSKLKGKNQQEQDKFYDIVDLYSCELTQPHNNKTYTPYDVLDLTLVFYEEIDFSLINSVYKDCLDKGIHVFYSKCPFDVTCLYNHDNYDMLNNYLKSVIVVPVVGEFDLFFIDSDYFYNMYYHMQSQYRGWFTNMVLDTLENPFREVGIVIS